MKFLLVFVAIFYVTLAKVSYEGYKVYNVFPETKVQEFVLRGFEDRNGYDFWSGPKVSGYRSIIMVKPELQEYFVSLLDVYNIKYEAVIENVQRVFEEEQTNMKQAKSVPKGKISFDNYHSHETITDYVRQIGTDYPELVELESIGSSYEGREMHLVKICSDVCGQKPGILIEGGIHAREWLSPSVLLYIIQELVENPTNAHLTQSVDWYILPVTNPDGYEYSRNVDRMWRKTRKPGQVCTGTDPNRNFDFHWMQAGASQDECSAIYAGPQPFSEPETFNFARFATANADVLKLYVAVHSYGPVFFYPWGYDYDAPLPDDWEELQELGDSVCDTINAVSGTGYVNGNSVVMGSITAGSTKDWCKSIGIELSYTMELPPGGSTGFDAPPSMIRGVVEESWEGFKVFHDYVRNKFGERK